MKFSVAALFAGVALVIAPLASYAYSLHVFQSLAVSAFAANGTLTMPEAPLPFQMISCVAGLGLVWLGYRIEMQAVPVAKAA